MKNWIIVGTFFCLWLSTSFSGQVQSFFAYSLITTVGILHGANDINILRSQNRKRYFQKGFWKILLVYLLVILAVLILFTVHPISALTLFVIFSGFHFGEQHLKNKITGQTKWSFGIYILYGISILFMIFYVKVSEVVPLIEQLTEITLDKLFFRNILIFSLFTFFISALIFRQAIKINLISEAFYILVLMIVFNTANLLWGFCIYFVLWHSIPSIQDQLKFLYGKVDKSSLLRYFKACWPYWFISILGLGAIYFIFKDDGQLLVTILIYLLSAITIPHILVMSRLESSK